MKKGGKFSVFQFSSDFQFFFSVFSDFRSRPLFELNGKKKNHFNFFRDLP